MRKPIILITVHRRYYELEKTIFRIEELKKEFSISPEIVIVWSCPEVGRLWFFQNLLKNQQISHLIYREVTEFDNINGPTTYLASLNIRKGLDFIKNNYPDDCYVLVNDADILPNPGLYKFIDSEMQNIEKDGVLFFWENGIRYSDTWHTNFFAVSLNEKYWPPISDVVHGDVLETQWGRYLSENNLKNFTVSHNSRNQKFLHVHESEKRTDFPFIPQKHCDGVFLHIRGYMSIYNRLKNFIRRLLWQ